MKYEYNLEKTVKLAGGGTATVSIGSPDPIDPADYMVLRPDAMAEMAGCLVGLANALRPPESPEIKLEK
jgi:hypothetical protein